MASAPPDGDDLVFEQLKLGPMENFSYVFGSRSTGHAAVVDPGFEGDRLVDAAEAAGLEVTHVVLTHSHRDHIMDLDAVLARTGAQLVAHPKAGIEAGVDVPVDDGQELAIAGVPVRAVYTPGHCPDHVAYVLADTALLTGDAVFIGECGRVDLPGSDVEAMWHTLMEVIPSLPGHLVVYPGHDYGPAPYRRLADELAENYTLETRTLDAFERFMTEP